MVVTLNEYMTVKQISEPTNCVFKEKVIFRENLLQWKQLFRTDIV